MDDLKPATCQHCEPWVRWFRNPTTSIPFRQVQHEPTCPTFPRVQRTN